MARSKATITLDRDKAAKAASLIGSPSISDVIDVALERLIRAEQLRHDLTAYRQQPLTEKELAIADLSVEFDLADADVDYDALYGSGE
jgi:hypothetical protein